MLYVGLFFLIAGAAGVVVDVKDNGWRRLIWVVSAIIALFGISIIILALT